MCDWSSDVCSSDLALCISWQAYPTMARNENFVAEVEAKGIGKDQPVLLLCRSGARSRAAVLAMTAAGFGPCYNVAAGLEGAGDSEVPRRSVGGWTAAGLPCAQGGPGGTRRQNAGKSVVGD